MKSWKMTLTWRRQARTSRSPIEIPSAVIAAGGRVVEAGEQLDERGLARAVDADDRRAEPDRKLEVETVEHRAARSPDTRTTPPRSGASSPAACAAAASASAESDVPVEDSTRAIAASTSARPLTARIPNCVGTSASG